ncbi:zf-HC2 domain-containing protein [Sorangium sp. So ce1036]|uniref:anti-sigma factor family protein n=1 Tax=Sorangium sp. So ce1036 TaxID=3133328 RepID=UPI003F03FE4C
MAGCDDDWFENISAWHDGEVTPEDAARIEAHLAGCAPCRGAAEALGRVRRALVARADPEVPPRVRERAEHAARGADPEVPPRVRERAEAAARRARAPRAWPWAITAGLAAAAGVAALLVGGPGRGVSAAMADELVTHHVRGFARERPCDIESSDPDAVAGWLEGRLGYAVTVPALPGARLLGARLCQIEGTRTAALMYTSGESPLTVFVPPPSSGAATAARALAGGGVGCTRGPLGNVICAKSVAQPMLAVAEVDAAALAPALAGADLSITRDP